MALRKTVYGACTPGKNGVHGQVTFDSILGTSKAICEAKRLAQLAARGDSNVLLLGESGCGKEVFARAIHSESKRRHAPFVAVNCAAIPDTLMESELFGYVEGAFTGAVRTGKVGKFELACGGTIFLDEIGDMSMPLQAKMLRVIQERVVERVGGTKEIPVDVRVISATNKNLEALMSQGRFRQDLFYRLDVMTIRIPPLRERIEDIPVIAYDLLKRLNPMCGTNVTSISPDVMNAFSVYDWPGNVRELENVLERALNLVEGTEIELHHLPQRFVYAVEGATDSCPRMARRTLSDYVSQFEQELILDALKACNNNHTMAAKRLGISRATLYKKLAKYSITVE